MAASPRRQGRGEAVVRLNPTRLPPLLVHHTLRPDSHAAFNGLVQAFHARAEPKRVGEQAHIDGTGPERDDDQREDRTAEMSAATASGVWNCTATVRAETGIVSSCMYIKQFTLAPASMINWISAELLP